MSLKNKMFSTPSSLSSRLTLWYGISVASLLVVALLSLYLAVGAVLDTRMDDDLIEDLAEFRSIHQQGGTEAVIAEMRQEAAGGEAQQVFLRLFSSHGALVFATDLTAWGELAGEEVALVTLDISQDGRLMTREFDGQDAPTRIITGVITDGLLLQIGESVEEKEEIIELLQLMSLVMLLLVIPLACGVGWWVARQAVEGIKAVSQAAVAIEKGQLDCRVSVKTFGDEIELLVKTFNAMAERIRKLIAEMREMTDNIAHDLRSPLARIRAISEATLSRDITTASYQKAAADTLEECDRLMQLINTTLDVAEAEAGVGNHITDKINISQLTEDACELFGPVAEQKHIRMSMSLEPDCRVRGNVQNLQRMLANLLDNALKYTPEKGGVAVKLASQPGAVNIVIADTGIGIPENEQPRVFDRFFRCDHSRSKKGCGLGLSYSRAVARAHGGDITLKSIPAKQSVFTVILPQSEANLPLPTT